ncbi:hypothetical protein GGR54DRAFT_639301 [Hypoxylon sp. NC1633]|nr:hypothetical protein GGR54DRAFT_639301 [Hypoxylon sp. NC1633]
MDPITAVGVAAAAVQFTEITLKITHRIAVFTILHDVQEYANGPKAFVESLRSQLRLLNSTIRRIQEGLTCNTDFRGDELLELSDYISNLNHHGEELDELLNNYLPPDGASRPARLLAALKSLVGDVQIKSVMDSIKQLLPLLTTFLLTSMMFKDGVALNAPVYSGDGMDRSRSHRTPGVIHQVSRHEVWNFVDRPGILAEVDRVLDKRGPQAPGIAVLQGMGGQGKTQLSLRYCANALSSKKFHYILWVDASTKASTVRSLEGISEELSDDNQVLLNTDARLSFVKRTLTVGNLPWLLVFDNYDDPAAFDLREYIPKGPLGRVLITSRSPDVERIGTLIQISGMTEEEARELLFKQLDATEDDTNRMTATDIVKRLGYLPLAIDQAGAYMKAEGIPLTDFLGHYDLSAIDILKSTPTLWEYKEPNPSDDEAKTSDGMAKTVFTTWNLSFTLLKPSTPTGSLKVTILSLLAFFDEHDISEEYFSIYHTVTSTDQQPEWMSLFTDEEGQWSGRKFDGVMREFARLSLITSLDTERKGTDFARVSLHPLVRDWINLRQENTTHRTNFVAFTRLLAASLSLSFWEKSIFDFGYKMSPTQRHLMEAHLNSWMKAFGRHKMDLRPTIISPEHEARLSAATAEQLIAIFLYENVQPQIDYELMSWLWESCDVSDSQMLRVKFNSGIHEIYCLIDMNLFEKAEDRSREHLQYWKTILDVDSDAEDMLHNALLSFVGTLLATVHVKDWREATELCRNELARLPDDERNMSKRHQLLTQVMIGTSHLQQHEASKAAHETLLNETERYGGNDFRARIWSSETWYSVILYSIKGGGDLSITDELSMAAMDFATKNYGIDNAEFFIFHLLRAKVLLSKGELVTAESMVRDGLQRLIARKHSADYYLAALETLGEILEEQKRYEEAYEVFNEALIQHEGYGLQNTTLRLLQCCGRVAEKFNIGLADAHYAMRLSLLKNIEDWGNIVDGIVDLFRMKIRVDSRISTQDALDLLLDGLTVYGIAVGYRGAKAREYLREVNVVIDLEDPEALQSLAEDDAVCKALVYTRFDRWHGFDLMIRMARGLLNQGHMLAAENAFRLATTTFEKARDLKENAIVDFLWEVFYYMELRSKTDRDEYRVRDISDWGRSQICEKLERNLDDPGDWWEKWNSYLLKIIEPPPGSVTSTDPSTMQRLSHRFSRALALKRPQSVRLRPEPPSIRDGLERAHSVAASPAGQAATRLVRRLRARNT